jgi:hypothetical protein
MFWFKKKEIVIPKELIENTYWTINIYLKDDYNDLLKLSLKSDNEPSIFRDILEWFAWRNSNGYLLEFNKGTHSLSRDIIKRITVYSETRLEEGEE